jgi:dihydroorotase
MIEALKDGTIDCIASDHAPHAEQDKQVELAAAPPGSVGLETTFPLIIEHLVRPGHLSLPRALSLITHKPAECIGIPGGTLARGTAADLTLFDPDAEWTVDARALHSKSKNSAFDGHTVHGRVRHTILGGVRVSPSAVGV